MPPKEKKEEKEKKEKKEATEKKLPNAIDSTSTNTTSAVSADSTITNLLAPTAIRANGLTDPFVTFPERERASSPTLFSQTQQQEKSHSRWVLNNVCQKKQFLYQTIIVGIQATLRSMNFKRAEYAEKSIYLGATIKQIREQGFHDLAFVLDSKRSELLTMDPALFDSSQIMETLVEQKRTALKNHKPRQTGSQSSSASAKPRSASSSLRTVHSQSSLANGFSHRTLGKKYQDFVEQAKSVVEQTDMSELQKQSAHHKFYLLAQTVEQFSKMSTSMNTEQIINNIAADTDDSMFISLLFQLTPAIESLCQSSVKPEPQHENSSSSSSNYSTTTTTINNTIA